MTKKKAKKARPTDELDSLDELDEVEGEHDDTDDAEEVVQAKVPVGTIVESPKSKAARAAKREPVDVAALKNRKTKQVTLRAVRMGFDGLRRIRPGAEFTFNAPLDDEGRVLLPTWAVLKNEYVPDPETQMPPGMQPRVRGGATQGGVRPQDVAL